MYLKKSTSLAFISLASAVALSGCAGPQLAVHTIKKLGIERDAQGSKGYYKVGKPYKIKGLWYYPKVDYKYRETGIASWYGAQFHGKKTANGEIFDMNLVSAAHRTLPMPSIVRVINLRNGRALKIRINDRGPFAHGRIIDLSRRAAQLLGFLREGTVPVRVEILEDESRFAAVKAQALISKATAVPSGEVLVTSLAADDQYGSANDIPGNKTIRLNTARMLSTSEPSLEQTQILSSQKIFIQAGAFINKHRADVLKYMLEKYGQTSVVSAKVGEQQFYRVRIGPVASVQESDNILYQVLKQGYPNAQVVID